ncbi:MAG: GTPase ObgE [Nitrospirae bacterium]|nr:GTPase ObgE [Nitrospirota bacterium]
MFIDQVTISIKAGSGGNGCVSFRREKYVPRGGPDGGDGGDGGNILVQASTDLHTLLDQKYLQRYAAGRGEHGLGKKMYGRGGADCIIRVPVGTMVYQEEPRTLLGDLTQDGQTLRVASGGRGGRGNAHFATPVKQVPRFAEEGRPGEERTLVLELKLMADVGIIGLPNAGKSTLLSRISSARPKIADYPFTTLVPQLGVVRWGREKSFVIADIPGLIEGAHEGRGLGLQFLRHIERTSLLVHLVDVSDTAMGDPVKDFEIVNRELARYRPGMAGLADLAAKPQVVVPTKTDAATGKGEAGRALARYCRKKGYPVFPISAVTGKGVSSLIRFLGKNVEERRVHT